jgi:sterol desaturase/sphingolipid hydroxylase (fatty acid hydroxylase superfamily)
MLSLLTSSLPLPAADSARPEVTARELHTMVILTTFAALLALEVRFGRRDRPAKVFRQSYLTNLSTFILNDTLLSLLSVSSLMAIASRYAQGGFLDPITSPLGKAVASFFLLDLTLYLWHKASHAYECLWMFHKVHHSDRCMNVSTAFRLHFMEAFLTTLVKAAFILVMGVDSMIVLASEAVITLCVMFHHSNLSFRAEHQLGRLIVVPYLHRVHHSTERAEHDHNYGFVFSFWDRIFGTLEELEPRELGLKHVETQGFLELVKFGLTRPVAPAPRSVHAMVAEAAYYKAERRGFAPGWEMADWLDAEKETLDQTESNSGS